LKNIWIIGTGGVGGYFGGLLAFGNRENKLGLHVFFLARGEHLVHIRRDGLLLLAGNRKLRCFPDAASDNPVDFPDPDLILLCVKAYDLTDVLRKIAPRVREATTVLPLLNGIDISRRIREYLPTGILLEACVFVGTHILSPGVIEQKGGNGRIQAGASTGEPFDPEPLRNLFAQTEAAFDWFDDPRPAVWGKYLFIASYGLVTAESGKSLDAVYADPALREEAAAVMREISGIARRKGVVLPSNAVENALEKAAEFPAGTRTSFQRDVETPGKRSEGDLFAGTILRFGRELGLPTPETERLARILGQHAEIPARKPFDKEVYY